jgi:hypothetical protein
VRDLVSKATTQVNTSRTVEYRVDDLAWADDMVCLHDGPEANDKRLVYPVARLGVAPVARVDTRIHVHEVVQTGQDGGLCRLRLRLIPTAHRSSFVGLQVMGANVVYVDPHNTTKPVAIAAQAASR